MISLRPFENRSLKTRLGVATSVLLALFGAALLALAIVDARNSVREEMEAGGRVARQLLGLVVIRESEGSLLPALSALGRVRAHEISLYGGGSELGSLRYRSPPSPYKAGRDAPAWFAHLITPEVTPLRVRRGEEVLVLEPDPSRAVLDAWDELLVLVAILVVLLLAINVLLRRLVVRALAGLDDVVAAMAQMEQGRLDARLAPQSLPELESVRRGFNDMAAALQSSRAEVMALAHEQEIARRTEERLDDERRAIARELHDELGQCITAIRSFAVSIAAAARENQPELARRADQVGAVAASMYDAVHAIVARLRPAALVRLGLVDGLQEWLAGWQACHPGRELRLTVDDELDHLPPHVEVAVLRIVQEAINNAVKHARAGALEVALSAERGEVTVSVADDGCGFDAAAAESGSGFGLAGMRERAKELGGELLIESVAGAGTRLVASFPTARGG